MAEPIGAPFDKEKVASITAEFFREGYCFLGNILSSDEVFEIKEAMTRIYDDPQMQGKKKDIIRGVNIMRMFEHDQCFVKLIDRHPILFIIESILGKDCHMIEQIGVVKKPNVGIRGDTGWHIDDRVILPFLQRCWWALECLLIDNIF